MKFLIRKPSPIDIGLYSQCFSDSEFMLMVYPGERININNYISTNSTDLKYVISAFFERGFTDIGFAHFYYERESEYTYVGGILPTFFNQGIGVYASVAVLKHLYDKRQNLLIRTGVYKYNVRSFKMLKALGFRITKETASKKILELTKKQFENSFASQLNLRIEYVAQIENLDKKI